MPRLHEAQVDLVFDPDSLAPPWIFAVRNGSEPLGGECLAF